MNIFTLQQELSLVFPNIPRVSQQSCLSEWQAQNKFLAVKLQNFVRKLGQGHQIQSEILKEVESKLKSIYGLLGRSALQWGFEKVYERLKKIIHAEKQLRYSNFSLTNQNFLLKKMNQLKAKDSLAWLQPLLKSLDNINSMDIFVSRNPKISKQWESLTRNLSSLKENIKSLLVNSDKNREQFERDWTDKMQLQQRESEAKVQVDVLQQQMLQIKLQNQLLSSLNQQLNNKLISCKQPFHVQTQTIPEHLQHVAVNTHSLPQDSFPQQVKALRELLSLKEQLTSIKEQEWQSQRQEVFSLSRMLLEYLDQEGEE